ncbi:MAG: response regulator [Elusimicrobia bacterium]|nr:response regulator [Elusimicrobiota bacterium]
MAKIVIIDDDPEIINLIGYALKSKGHAVAICSNGREAMSAVKKFKPDLLILDVMLPGVDGFAIATTLSHDEQTKNLPIIVITALEQSQGMFEKIPQVKTFLVKPFSSGKVLSAVKSILPEAAPRQS